MRTSQGGPLEGLQAIRTALASQFKDWRIRRAKLVARPAVLARYQKLITNAH